MNLIDVLLDEKIVAVLRADSHEEALKYVDLSISGGVRAIELTYSIPDVCLLIPKVLKKYPNVILGIGSILNLKMAVDAYEAGATYLVSPGFVEEVSDYCLKNDIFYMPGCFSVTEILNAYNKGHKIIKLFPGSEISQNYIKAIKAPIPDVLLMVTGGVDIDNIKSWFDAGVSMVGIGAALFKVDVKEFREKL